MSENTLSVTSRRLVRLPDQKSVPAPSIWAVVNISQIGYAAGFSPPMARLKKGLGCGVPGYDPSNLVGPKLPVRMLKDAAAHGGS